MTTTPNTTPDTPTIAARVVLALVDDDLDAAVAAVLSVGDDVGALRLLVIALAQLRASVTTPEDAAQLVQGALDRAEGVQ